MHIPFRRRTLTGAWIETLVFLCSESCLAGRTLTGAWIETSNGVQLVHVIQVAPSRVRGLKLSVPYF